MSSKPIVLITGISGFVGSHVAVELAKEGYAVRGTARSKKRAFLESTLTATYPDISIVALEDVVDGDITETLKGVHAVIHIASPLAGKKDAEQSLKDALGGTLNILRQAAHAGVNKVVLTSSWGATLHPSLKEAFQEVVFDANSWGDVTVERDLPGPNPMYTYLVTKILAERAAWELNKEYPALDLTTINPPFIYGPYAPGFPLPARGSLGTNGLIYSLIAGGALPPSIPNFFVDVRDVAKAHVAALQVKESILGRNKRYLLCGGYFTWKEAVDYIQKEFPELKSRLPSIEKSAFPRATSRIDDSPAVHELQMREYVDWEKCMKDTIKALLEAEESWKAT